MKKTTIGILAGMGPRSTSPFLEILLDQCQEQYGAKYDIDYPHIMIYSLPTPFYIDRETNEEELKESIKDGIERLQNCGVDLIGIACNSAHNYFEYITESITSPVLNIVNETIQEIEIGSKVSVFATEMARTSSLYQTGIALKKCEYIFKDEWQRTINQIILRIKNKENLDETKDIWEELVSEAQYAGVEKIIIACTDLNVAIDENNSSVKYIDSAKALASSLIKKYLEIDA
jgi:aspartate racemase